MSASGPSPWEAEDEGVEKIVENCTCGASTKQPHRHVYLKPGAAKLSRRPRMKAQGVQGRKGKHVGGFNVWIPTGEEEYDGG